MSFMVYVLLFVLLIMGVVMIIWIALCLSVSYQQTLSVSLSFDETYRYVPDLNHFVKNQKLDSIKVTVFGPLKKDAVIAPGNRIKRLIEENITAPYVRSLLVQEAKTLTVEESALALDGFILKRVPIPNSPTLENLSAFFFKKLSLSTKSMGCQLVAVKLSSEGMKVTHSRQKISKQKV